jgi:hypothetical protein
VEQSVPRIFTYNRNERYPGQAARIDARKLSTSSLSWLAWFDSDWAEDKTCPDAEPVSAAP